MKEIIEKRFSEMADGINFEPISLGKKNLKFLKKNSREKNYRKIFKKKEKSIKPFINSFSGHKDGISCIYRHPINSSLFFSGGYDGEIKTWLINQEKCVKTILGHERFIRGLAVDSKGKFLLSCSDDRSVKMWNLYEKINFQTKFYLENGIFTAIATHPKNSFFVTGGNELLLWDQLKFEPIQKLLWGISSISSIEFNPLDYNIICSCGSDRSIILYDLRLGNPIKKIVLDMCSNDISWNLINSFEFTVANENGNLYAFDLRNLEKISKIYRGHVMAALCVDMNPKSHSLVSGSSDNTLRFFDNFSTESFEVFFTPRMRRISDVCFSLDGNFVLSASEDGNLRMWKKSFEKKNNLTFFKKKKILDDQKFFRFKKEKSLVSTNLYLLPKIIRNLTKLKIILGKSEIIKHNRTKKHLLPGYSRFGLKLKKSSLKEFS